MIKTRVIPVLLLKGQGLYKTKKFRDPRYVGDPINAVKIFNEKEVDELVFLDISATNENRKPNFEIIANIASEAFMPLAYGGGVRNLEDINRLFSIGIEKVVLNSYAVENPQFISEAAEQFGSQSIVISIDAKKNLFGNYHSYIQGGSVNTKKDPSDWAKIAEDRGAGEILINSMDRDGTKQGYDLELVKEVTNSVSIPVIACGGAGTTEDFRDAYHKAGASALAAGSMFVFHGKHDAVLITYPDITKLEKYLP